MYGAGGDSTEPEPGEGCATIIILGLLFAGLVFAIYLRHQELIHQVPH